jgi:hypothetical protein
MNPRKIYEKYCDGTYEGEPISDEELFFGLSFFTDLEEKLEQLGPRFYIAKKEVGRVLEGLERYHFTKYGEL